MIWEINLDRTSSRDDVRTTCTAQDNAGSGSRGKIAVGLRSWSSHWNRAPSEVTRRHHTIIAGESAPLVVTTDIQDNKNIGGTFASPNPETQLTQVDTTLSVFQDLSDQSGDLTFLPGSDFSI
jgi:hypothetical protein